MIMNDSPVVTKSNITPAQISPSHFLANSLLPTMKSFTVRVCSQAMIPPDNSAKLLVCYSVIVRREISSRTKQNKSF